MHEAYTGQHRSTTLDDVMAKALALWPEWKPNAEQVAEWKAAFRYIRPEVAMEAVRQCFRRSTWREPRIGNVLAEAGSIRRAQAEMSRAAEDERERISTAGMAAESRKGHAMMRAELGRLSLAALIVSLEDAAVLFDDEGLSAWADAPIESWPNWTVGCAWAALKDGATERANREAASRSKSAGGAV